MRAPKFLKDLHKSASKNAPTIFTVVGGAGVIALIFLASKSALKAKDDLEQKQQELQKEQETDEPVDIPLKEKVVIYGKAYIPTIALAVATEACLYKANDISKKRIAAISAAYILSESNFKEYKDQVEEVIGSKKAQEIKDSIIQKHLDNTQRTEDNTVTPVKANIPQLSLWFDDVSKRYFYSNAELIRKAAISATEELHNTGFVSLNRVYEFLGMEGIYFGDDNGWSKDITNEVIIEISHGLSGRLSDYNALELMGGSGTIGVDIPIGVIHMEVHPSSAFFSEV